ncbi:MAG: hypothetical protein Q7K34_04015 [archaeon]|nr:hypothetical protein [archaeon]
MKPDMVILKKRIREEAARLFQEVEADGTTSYTHYFPTLERKLSSLFAEYELKLHYKGRHSNVFPSTLFWGKQTVDPQGNTARQGEIDLLHNNKKVGSIWVTFSLKPLSSDLANPPSIVIEEH